MSLTIPLGGLNMGDDSNDSIKFFTFDKIFIYIPAAPPEKHNLDYQDLSHQHCGLLGI